MNTRNLIALLGAGLLATCAVACGGAEEEAVAENNGANNGGGKADTPAGKAPAEEQCLDRRSDVLESANQHFIDTAVRWACADVAGVNTVGGDDRGQEYCEYFAIVQPPPIDGEEDSERPAAITLGQNQEGGGTSPLKLELNDDQVFWLEDHPEDVVGQCAFTSWHADINPPLPVCGEDQDCADADLYGIPLNAKNFRMKVSFNSNSAASALVNECAEARIPFGDPENADDPYHGDFFRGCMVTANLYGTQWRRSDPQVCAAAVRLVECGCSIPNATENIGRSLVPPQDGEKAEEIGLWGFPLGTWSGQKELPLGCRHVEIGHEGQNIVACDLTGQDVLNSLEDPKEACRTKYGDNVVVHVPVPQGVIECDPSKSDSPYTEHCDDMPWVVQR
jgi:hypothetical protein